MLSLVRSDSFLLLHGRIPSCEMGGFESLLRSLFFSEVIAILVLEAICRACPRAV